MSTSCNQLMRRRLLTPGLLMNALPTIMVFKVCQYHSDNGWYSEKAFQEAVVDVAYFSIDANHQHGIAASRIKYMTLATRNMILHIKRLWPGAITIMLWPYSIKSAGECHKRFHLNDDRLCPLKRFSGVKTTFYLKLKHTWGCPSYKMDEKLLDCSGGIPK